jgi:ABC-type transport system substrate-binding protein
MNTYTVIRHAMVLALTSVLVVACVPAPTAVPTMAPEATEEVPAEMAAATQPSPAVNKVGKVMPPDAAPLEQQVVRFLSEETKHLDISYNLYDAGRASHILWEPLVQNDENFEPVPAAADSWEVSEDGKTWIFHLRNNAVWSDCTTPVTAHDFEYAFQRGLHPDAANGFAWYYSDVEGVEEYNEGKLDWEQVGFKALDDYTFAVTTKDVTPYLPKLMTYAAGSPVPRERVEQYGDQWTLSPDTILSSSAWKLVEWTRGKQIVLELNECYNGPNKPYFEKLIFKLGDESNVFTTFQAGEIDLTHHDTPAISQADLEVIASDPQLQKSLHASPSFDVRYIFFTVSKPPFDDVKVRQAFAHAIDKELLTDTVLKGVGVTAWGMLPTTFTCYQGDALKPYQSYDPELARQLLAEAGYPNGEGFPEVEFWGRAPTSTDRAVMEAVQAMLKENLSVNVSIQAPERKVFMDAMSNREFPMGLVGWAYDYIDESDFLDVVWHSRTPRHDWVNEEFDQLTDMARPELDPAKRCELYREAERVLAEEAPAIFLWYPVANQLYNPRIKGWTPDRQGDIRIAFADLPWMGIYWVQGE